MVREMGKKNRNFMESIVLVVIVLVLIQTFLDDLSVISGWSWDIRKILIFTGFGFDLFFTAEFLLRFFDALLKRKVKIYFLFERGWIDLAASIPLLILNSGPSVYALLTGTVFAGSVKMLNILKVVKAVRIARILRLLRLLKIFKQIKFADSVMTQRHSTRIITTIVTSLILVVTLSSLLFSFVSINDTEDKFSQAQFSTAGFISSEPESIEAKNIFTDYCENQTSLLIVKKGALTLYSRFSDSYYLKYYGPSDYNNVKLNGYEFFFDLKPVQKRQARESLIYFIIILAMIMAIMITYSPHFAITVSDPVNVMIKGLSEKSYNLEVSIPENLKKDDIFILAQKFNEEYLPLKAAMGTKAEPWISPWMI